MLWSLDKQAVSQMFDQLSFAKAQIPFALQMLERAIERYRAFEEDSSALAVTILSELGFPAVLGSYTNFMRADLEAMCVYHRTGSAPVWRVFFDKWNEQVSSGCRKVEPFHPKPIPTFVPTEIERQEILQQQDDNV